MLLFWSLLHWKLLGPAKGIVRHGERIPFVPPQIWVPNKLQVQSYWLRLANLFITNLGLRQDLADDMAHHNSLIQSLEIDPANFELLVNILFQKLLSHSVELHFSLPRRVG